MMEKRPKKFFLDIQEEIEALKDQGFEKCHTPTDLWVYEKLCILWGEENPRLMVMQKKEVLGDKWHFTTAVVEVNSLGVIEMFDNYVPLSSELHSQLQLFCNNKINNQ